MMIAWLLSLLLEDLWNRFTCLRVLLHDLGMRAYGQFQPCLVYRQIVGAQIKTGFFINAIPRNAFREGSAALNRQKRVK